MVDSVDNLFLLGDDFKEILGILKGDEDIEEQFTVEVTNVSITAGNLMYAPNMAARIAIFKKKLKTFFFCNRF